jgi:hypothetical protein
VQNLASSIGTRFKGRTDISVTEAAYDSGVADAFTVSVETSSFSAQVQLGGVRETARKVEKTGAYYVARVLARISAEDYAKALRYIENEEAAFLAYRFFGQKVQVLALSGDGGAPPGYPDFYTWLRNECVILQAEGGGQGFAGQIEVFAKKLYRVCLVFACALDGMPSRVVYEAARYSAGLYGALSGFSMIRVTRRESGFVLAPGDGGVAAFAKAVAEMKDASKIFVTGVEVIHTGTGRVVNAGNLVINQFKAIAGWRFGMSAVNYDIPARFTEGGNLDTDGIIAYIQAHAAGFPARWAAIVYAEAAVEPAMLEFNVGPRAGASCSFTLYDAATGKVLSSETSRTNAIFTLADEGEQTILNESRRALRFLFDPKNQPGLEEIMAGVLE